MIDWREREALDEKIRDCIRQAEAEYDDPYLVIVVHDSIYPAIKQNIAPSGAETMKNIKMNGWDVISSSMILLAVVVCGEGASDAAALSEQRRLKEQILGNL